MCGGRDQAEEEEGGGRMRRRVRRRMRRREIMLKRGIRGGGEGVEVGGDDGDSRRDERSGMLMKRK